MDVVDEGFCERLGKFQSGTFGSEIEVEIVALRRYVTTDNGSCIGIYSRSLDVYLLIFCIPFDDCIQSAHPSVFEFELFDNDLGVCFQIS